MADVTLYNASLLLKTTDTQMADGQPYAAALTDFSTSRGSATCNGQYLVWKNVDMRAVLGNLYDKYDAFNMKVSAVNYSTSTATLTQESFGIWYIKMKSCEMVNQCYNHANGGFIDCSPLVCVNHTHSTANSVSGVNSLTSSVVSFRKPQSGFTDIHLEFCNLRNQTPVNGLLWKSTVVFGHVAFIIDIFPILESRIVKRS
ncbi:MAG: hypothetical protein EOP48_01325 [Sphingobacteriales bacterium]|nr:MAG: hypothetical protein EOP48_01325 [Sphingobacteriales bacterium]